jgi:polysaccharide export outer membrane protein
VNVNPAAPPPGVEGAESGGDESITLALQRAQFNSSFQEEGFQGDYRVGAGDMLEVEVVGKSEFGGKARVSPRGEISLPFIGSVRVEGMTATEAAASIESVLQEGYLRDPDVNVFVAEFTRYKVFVYGAVASPGIVELAGPRRLLDVLMLAGGLRETAGSTAIVYRANPSQELLAEQMARLEVLGTVAFGHDIQALGAEVVDLKRLAREGDFALNLPIFPQDRINVLDAGRVYVRGNIPKPGEFPLKGSGTTLTQLIAQAGGYMPFRAHSVIQVTRKTKEGQEPERIALNARDVLANDSPDFLLRDGDDLYFPSSWWRASISDTLAFLDRVLFGFGPRFVGS